MRHLHALLQHAALLKGTPVYQPCKRELQGLKYEDRNAGRRQDQLRLSDLLEVAVAFGFGLQVLHDA